MAKKIDSFNGIVGHKNLITFLQQKLEKDNIQDFIIFYGQPGIGKSSVAKVLAVELATKYESKELHDEYLRSVVYQNKSTDSIKIFNMSEIEDKEEEIKKVKAELNTSFSTTGKKILILDEAQNMSKKAQDSMLPELEHLPENIYVFVCTTEFELLTDALRSRCKSALRFNNLSDGEARLLTKQVIRERHLTFDMTEQMVVSIICRWAENQPRKIKNLLENFEVGAFVSSKDIEVFVNTTSSASIIELVKYLYGSMTLGINYIDSMKVDESFVSQLIEFTKVALGGESTYFNTNDVMFIREFMRDKDEMNIMKFTAEVAGLSTLRRRRIISAFMKANVGYVSNIPAASVRTSIGEDLQTLAENVERQDITDVITEVEQVQSLDELFANADFAD